MHANDIIAAIQAGTCDFELDAISRAIVSREIVWKREIDADALSERRGAMREAVHERHLERIGTRVAPPAATFKPGCIVRVKQSSNLSPRYLVGRELVFIRARVSNAEVRYLVADDSKFGKLARFACPMRDLEFVRDY